MVKLDCEAKPFSFVSPHVDKFTSYKQYRDWLNKTHLSNEVSVTYDFKINPSVDAPELVKKVFHIQPQYRFIGTHILNNSKIVPDSCTSSISYFSNKVDNTTTITLNGFLTLNNKPYNLPPNKISILHSLSSAKVINTDKGKKLYNSQFLYLSELTSVHTYIEYSQNKGLWPDIPSSTYRLVRKSVSDSQKVQHISCTDGETGIEIDMLANKLILSVEYDINTIEKVKYNKPNVSVVENNHVEFEHVAKDETGKYYIIKYRNISLEQIELDGLIANLGIEYKIKDYDTKLNQLKDMMKRYEIAAGENRSANDDAKRLLCEYSNTNYSCGFHAEGQNYPKHKYSKCCDLGLRVIRTYEEMERYRMALYNTGTELRGQINKLIGEVRNLMHQGYPQITGAPHPREKEFETAREDLRDMKA